MEAFAKRPARVQVHQLPANYDAATHHFCEENNLLCRYHLSGVVTVTVPYPGGDSRVLKGNAGDWIVIDNGAHLLDPSVFEARYSFSQDIAA